MAKSNSKVVADAVVQITHSVVQFDGIARSIECFDNQGFKNYRVVTLYLDCGMVVKKSYSDPYASFEAVTRLDLANQQDLTRLMTQYQNGKAMGEV